MEKEWFGTWFDSPYYHILYKNRDEKEAQNFIEKLTAYFEFRKEEKILDLACGKGRHSIFLNQKGFEVTGIDLSKESIEKASESENSRLKFFVHDMRKVFRENEFDYVLNLFTSFGYFEKEEENLQAIQAVNQNLKMGGKFLIDFFNPDYVLSSLVAFEKKTIEGICFKITKNVEKNWIIKNIYFEAENRKFHFQEKVKLLSQAYFLDLFQKAGFKVLKLFGNYELEAFDKQNSDRMIFLVEKNAHC